MESQKFDQAPFGYQSSGAALKVFYRLLNIAIKPHMLNASPVEITKDLRELPLSQLTEARINVRNILKEYGQLLPEDKKTETDGN